MPIIRQEQPNDYAEISKLVYTAFTDHPHHAPGAKPTEHLIVTSLRESNALTLSLVANKGDAMIGHIAFSEILINGEPDNWYGLGPVAVHPASQRQGVGSALIQHGIKMLREQSAKGLVLLGDPQYYSRFGFVARSSLTLTGVPAEFFLVLAFDEIPTGQVTYHEAFYEHA